MSRHEALIELIQNNRPWLMERVFRHVEENGYLPYVPTETTIWLAALEKINQTFALAVQSGDIPPLRAELRHDDDPIRQFAIAEAKNHRKRGVSFPIFLGVLKYIEESHLDLVRHKIDAVEDKINFLDTLRHFFEHLTIEFCVIWAGILSAEASEEERKATLRLEEKNRQLHREHAEQQQLIKKLEGFQNQLLQSEKMASIGLLAAGVAHEINNPIAYVFSNMGTLEKYLAEIFSLTDMYESQESRMVCLGEELDKIREFKTQIDFGYIKDDSRSLLIESREGLNRVKKIILDLKDFSRAGLDEKWELADLHAGLDSTLNIVWNELKYKCEVKKEYGTLPMVTCLPRQLNQVFMNLLVNAAHAIETRGIVTLRSGRDNDHVWVEVEDTGKGIPSENLSRIFDPFFTTKPVGKGTGLGLSVSYNIIEKHHGTIEVKSEVGKGTIFRVTLPIEQADAVQPDTAH